MLDRYATQAADAPIRTADGGISVGGPGLGAADRLLLVRFIDDLRARMRQTLGVPLHASYAAVGVWAAADEPAAGPDAPLEPLPPDALPGAGLVVRVAAGQQPPIRLTIRRPQTLDARELAQALCTAWLRADALAAGWADPPGHPARLLRNAPYPEWFGLGVARGMDRPRRQADAEETLARWSRAELPPVTALLRSFSPYADADPALASQLVAWVLEAATMSGLRDAVIAADGWSVAAVAGAMGLERDLAALGGGWDLWLLKRRWAVLTPGLAHDALWARTPPQLLVRPGNPGTPLDAWQPPVPKPPSELIRHRRASWMPATASRKVFEMQRLAAGRDERYQHMAAAYTEFFVALQRGDPARRLRHLLERADERFRTLAPPEAAEAADLPPLTPVSVDDHGDDYEVRAERGPDHSP